jgi:hypothetical protein
MHQIADAAQNDGSHPTLDIFKANRRQWFKCPKNKVSAQSVAQRLDLS